MNFYPTDRMLAPSGMPTELIETDWDTHKFLEVFGDPFPAWTSATFLFKAPEWAWKHIGKPTIVKAAAINGKIVVAVDSPETFCEFLAFVEFRRKIAR